MPDPSPHDKASSRLGKQTRRKYLIPDFPRPDFDVFVLLTPEEIRKEIQRLKNRVAAIFESATSEDRELTVDEATEVDGIQGTKDTPGRIDALQESLERQERFQRLLQHGVRTPPAPAADPQTAGGGDDDRQVTGGGSIADADILPQYVQLGQMAAIIQRSKRTLEKWKSRDKNPLPPPDIEGGGGTPDEWDWSTIRPWLEEESGRKLPARFPSMRPALTEANRS